MPPPNLLAYLPPHHHAHVTGILAGRLPAVRFDKQIDQPKPTLQSRQENEQNGSTATTNQARIEPKQQHQKLK